LAGNKTLDAKELPMSPWINGDGQVVHPNAPRGSGGPGRFTLAGPLGGDVDPHVTVPHPNSPAGRYLALNERQKKHLERKKSTGTAPAEKAPKPVTDHLKRKKSTGTAPAKKAPKLVTDQSVQKSVAEGARKRVGKTHLGRRGECYDLPDLLLKHAHGKTASDFTPIPEAFKGDKAQEWYDNADYVWGDQVDLKSVQSGDILQFRNHKIRIDTLTTDEAGNSYQWTEDHSRAHHTAVVSSNDGNGELTIIEQHVEDPTTRKPSQLVLANKLYLTNKIYETTKRTSKKDPKLGNLTGELTLRVTITVEGVVNAYRPKAK
jgi:hypothetical protein